MSENKRKFSSPKLTVLFTVSCRKIFCVDMARILAPFSTKALKHSSAFQQKDRKRKRVKEMWVRGVDKVINKNVKITYISTEKCPFSILIIVTFLLFNRVARVTLLVCKLIRRFFGSRRTSLLTHFRFVMVFIQVFS